MNVTHNVVTDLLPLYLAGEASDDTRVLVEAYLKQNPSFAVEVREQADKSNPDPTVPKSHRPTIIDG